MIRSRLRAVRALFPGQADPAESSRIGRLLRTESVGGFLLVGAALVGILWANSPWSEAYTALRDLRVGYEPWHLDLTLGTWAADGLLAIFFFLVGLELKREVVAGELRRFRTAIVPVAAAAGGVLVPALIYAAVVWQEPALRVGWAIPTATDIAFAVAVLALVGSHLPSSLRIFLLTLAVVDDLIAIVIIAIFYTTQIQVVPLLAGALTIAVYGVIAQRYERFFRLRAFGAWLVLLPIGLVAWGFIHASGIHATIAGVALAFTIPVRPRRGGADSGLSEEFEHRFRPISTGFAVPVFAFFSAGVAIGGPTGFVGALADPVTIGIVAGLVLGKPLGILLTTRVMTWVTRAELDPTVRWIDLAGVGVLAGIGFTVSLLVGELSFPADHTHHDDAKIAVLVASVLASVLASVVLIARNRRYKALAER